MMRPRALLPLVAATFLLANSAHGESATEARISQAVEQALKAWQVPGVAVAIIRDGQVIYLKGHGVKRLGRKDPITPDTVFPLASCTKGFTTAALAVLVDEGKLDWDDPVRKHVPYFHLSDPLADGDVRLRDLLCHRTGVRGHDFLWYRSPLGHEESIRRIGRVPLDKPFRTTLQYQNIMYLAVGQAVRTASGSAWEDFVSGRLLGPLGMTNTHMTSTAAEKSGDVALPHRRNEEGHVELVPRYAVEVPDAASSIHSSARDLATWLRFQLGDGAWNGKRVVSAKNLGETHMPQIPIRLEGVARALNPDTRLMSYCMGWLAQDYRGHQLLFHAGAVDGFRAHLAILPDDKLGLVLLNNLQDTRMNLALSNTLLDLLLDLKPDRDWNAFQLARLDEEKQAAEKRLNDRLAKRRPDAKPSRPLAAYAGAYEEPAYGTARVALEDDRLVWRWSTFTCALEAFDSDTFLARDPVLGTVFFTFSPASTGAAVSLHVSEPLDVRFKKTP